MCLITHAQSRNLPLTNRRIEFNGQQRVTFYTRRNNNLQLKVLSADRAQRVVRVRENQLKNSFVRTKLQQRRIMTTTMTMMMMIMTMMMMMMIMMMMMMMLLLMTMFVTMPTQLLSRAQLRPQRLLLVCRLLLAFVLSHVILML